MPPSCDASHETSLLDASLSASRAARSRHPLRDALLSTHRVDLVCGALWYLLGVGAMLANPMIIFEFLKWVTAVGLVRETGRIPLNEPISSPAHLWRGAVLAVALGVASLVSFISESRFAARTAHAGRRARLGVGSLVFRALTVKGVEITTAGEAHNLHGVNTAALADLPSALTTLILQPLEIGAIVALLAVVVGAGAGGAVVAVGLCVAVVVSAGTTARNFDDARGKAADARVSRFAEFLAGMRAAKLLGWEARFAPGIRAAREAESILYAKAAEATAFVHVAASNGVDLISVGLLLVFVYAMRANLTPSLTFTYWVLLATLHSRIFHYPVAVSQAREGMAALARLDAFIAAAHASERAHVDTVDPSLPAGSVVLTDAAFSWSAAQPPRLTLSARISRGELWVVCGPVGAGKTLLLSSLLGESALVGGALATGAMNAALVPQSPWTLPATVRENILVGRPFDGELYARVVAACALERDFEAWPERDLSSVSSTVLSGGQRARVALARAAYGRPDVVLLDDTLAALDARVGAAVRENLILGDGALLAGATRIVATHAPGWLETADGIIVLVPRNSGDAASIEAVVFQGAGGAGHAHAAALARAQVDAELAAALAGNAGGASEADADADESPLPASLQTRAAGDAAGVTRTAKAVGDDAPSAAVFYLHATAPQLPGLTAWLHGVGGLAFGAPIIVSLFLEASFVEASAVTLQAWSDALTTAEVPLYFGVYGACVAGEFCAAYIRQRLYASATRRAADGLHSALLDRVIHAPQSFFDAHSPGAVLGLFGRDLSVVDQTTWYASEYFSLSICYCVLVFAFQMAYTPWSIFAFVVPAVIGAPLAGRILSPDSGAAGALSDDIADVDIDSFLRDADPATTPTPPLPRSIGALRTYEARARVPLVTLVSVVDASPSMVRVFPMLAARLARAEARAASAHARALAAVAEADERALLFANLLGALYYVLQTIVVVPIVVRGAGGGLTDSLSGGSAGFLVVNAAFASYLCTTVLQNSATLGRLQLIRSQLNHAATSIPQEVGAAAPSRTLQLFGSCADAGSSGPLFNACRSGSSGSALDASKCPSPAVDPPAGWPSRGAIVFDSAALRYTAQRPLALNHVKLSVAAGSYTAVVGRTGAGKSTLVTALTRLVELESGAILVDGVDIATLALRTLRSSFVVISQDPLFFEASLRMNLDPFAEYTDAALRDALVRVGLGDGLAGGGGARVASAPATPANGDDVALSLNVAPDVLDTRVAARGVNLSGGQAQLLAIARALLRRPTLLVLDEATAALSAAAERLVLRTVREVFAGTTVLAITHRLVGAICADTVAVMQDGAVVELDSPQALLSRSTGVFKDMVAAAGGLHALERA